MFTREEAIRRLEDIEREIRELKMSLQEEWPEAPSQNATQLFLSKCGGWQDSRSPEKIIADIYASRTVSNRGAHLFDEQAR